MLTRDDVLELLRELADELHAQQVKGHLFVVGGAAMALAFRRDRITRDVAAVFEPAAVVRDAARRVGRRHGLGEGWLTDAVKGFVLGEDPDATTLFDHPGLAVQVASPRYLFVMKALAARVERDADDLRTLFAACAFTDVDEALDVVQETAPRELIHPKTEFLLRELLGSPDPRDHSDRGPRRPHDR